MPCCRPCLGVTQGNSPVPISCPWAGLSDTVQCSLQEMFTEESGHLGQRIHCEGSGT